MTAGCALRLDQASKQRADVAHASATDGVDSSLLHGRAGGKGVEKMVDDLPQSLLDFQASSKQLAAAASSMNKRAGRLGWGSWVQSTVVDGWNGDEDGLVGTLETRPVVPVDSLIPSVWHDNPARLISIDQDPQAGQNRHEPALWLMAACLIGLSKVKRFGGCSW